MSKRPGEPATQSNGKAPRIDDPVAQPEGVVKKTGPRLPMIVYKEGEPLNELVSYFQKEGGSQSVEVRIPAHCLTSNNRQVRARQLWGSDVYTSDSDLVAVLMHCGYVHHTMSHPPQQVAEIRAVLQPLEAQPSYASTARNSIRSRAWAASIPGCSYKVEKAWVVTRSGTTYDLQGHQDGPPIAAATFAPIQLERMVTRSSAGVGARQRLLQEVTAMFNLVNEPWLKYNLTAVADRGLKPHEWTSARLHNHVLYLESHKQRYELSRVPLPEGSEEGVKPDRYRFCLCKAPMLAATMRRLGVPLPTEEKELLHDDLVWESIKWGAQSVTIADQAYPLVRIHFMSMEAEVEEAEADEEADGEAGEHEREGSVLE